MDLGAFQDHLSFLELFDKRIRMNASTIQFRINIPNLTVSQGIGSLLAELSFQQILELHRLQ